LLSGLPEALAASGVSPVRADTSVSAYGVPDPFAVRSAVRRAWTATLGAGSYRDNATLAEAGCDSLRLLQFVLILERSLERTIPLDVLSGAMRPAEIEAALCRPEMRRPVDDARPSVFLFPGLDDDEYRLALFRVALQSRIRFILIEYPDWPEMARPGWGFTDLVDAVTRQVATQSAGGLVLLTGYSFGGEVAFAAARLLVATQSPVRWLGILDTDISHVPQPLSGGLAARLQHYVQEIVRDVRHDRLHKGLGLLLAKMARYGSGLTYAAHSRWWRELLPLRTQFWFDRRTRSILRMRALWAWLDAGVPGASSVPTTLFRSQAGRASSPPGLGWEARCPSLSIVQVPGDHHTLFDAPNRDVLCARYAELVEGLAQTQQRLP
jgi:thioesterase domain-containing protein